MNKQKIKYGVDQTIKQFKEHVYKNNIKLPLSVKIVEVGPRDGLQNEQTFVPTSCKIKLINDLSRSGLQTIEVTSFVSPKWIPQFSDNSQVFSTINRSNKSISYPVLVPNRKGLDQALECGVQEIAVFGAASETFTMKNTNCDIKESLNRFREVTQECQRKGIKIRGYVSCVMGCPYEGEVKINKVNYVANSLLELGCYEVSLGDTIGAGNIQKCIQLMEGVKCLNNENMAIHFHDTNYTAISNILKCLEYGVKVIDSSIGGLGGCPYAKKANGNVATENVVYLLDQLNIHHGLNSKLIHSIADEITKKLDKISTAFI